MASSSQSAGYHRLDNSLSESASNVRVFPRNLYRVQDFLNTDSNIGPAVIFHVSCYLIHGSLLVLLRESPRCLQDVRELLLSIDIGNRNLIIEVLEDVELLELCSFACSGENEQSAILGS